MIFECKQAVNKLDGGWHPFLAIRRRHLDSGKCIVFHRCERRYVETDPGTWAGGGAWEWHYRDLDGTPLGMEKFVR